MYMTGQRFPYFECGRCGALSAVENPEDLSLHYDASYYSMNGDRSESLRLRLRSVWDRCAALDSVVLDRRFGALFARRPPAPLEWGVLPQIGFGGSILDVGCGAGHLLARLATMGFSDLTGIDPFLDPAIVPPPGVELQRAALDDVDRRFDLIMFHHSFEHVVDPTSTLASAAGRLSPAGRILIRVPVAQTHAWRTFGVDWVQLDPPRHIVVPSTESMEILAASAGLGIERTIFDSTGMQFWGSIQAQRGIALQSPESYAVNPDRSAFSTKEIRGFERRARELNRLADGDQAAFVLCPLR